MKERVGGTKKTAEEIKRWIHAETGRSQGITDFTVRRILKGEELSRLSNINLLANYLGFDTKEAARPGFVDVVPIEGDLPFARSVFIGTGKRGKVFTAGDPLSKVDEPEQVIDEATKASSKLLKEGKLELAYEENRKAAEACRAICWSSKEIEFRVFSLKNARPIGRADLIQRTLEAIRQILRDDKLRVFVSRHDRSAILIEIGNIAIDVP